MIQVKYTPASQVVCTVLDEHEAVLLHLETKHYYVLNETGTLIWECLQKGEPLHVIAAALAQEYHIDKDEALQDVVQFLDMLSQEHLVERKDISLHTNPSIRKAS